MIDNELYFAEIVDLEFRFNYPDDSLTRNVAELQLWAINEAESDEEAIARLINRIKYERAEHIGIANQCLEAEASQKATISREDIDFLLWVKEQVYLYAIDDPNYYKGDRLKEEKRFRTIADKCAVKITGKPHAKLGWWRR